MSLYTSVQHNLGIEAINYYLSSYGTNLRSRYKKGFFLNLS